MSRALQDGYAALLTGAGLALALACGPALAQERSDEIMQVRPAHTGAARPIEQISEGDRIVAAPLPVEGQAGAPVQQLSTSAEATEPVRQLSSGAPGAEAPRQLYGGGKTAQPPQSLSEPGDGRTAAVTPVSGEDACDPGEQGSSEKPRICRHVIETRAAEFRRPDPAQLSPEQRLLIQQRLREGSTTTSATRRLASDGGADTLEGLAVASIVLGAPNPPKEEGPADPNAEAATDAAAVLVTEIINQITTVGPAPR